MRSQKLEIEFHFNSDLLYKHTIMFSQAKIIFKKYLYFGSDN